MSRCLRPQPRLALRQALLAHARASMDLSDGLAKDLGRMARASGCGARVDLGAVPLARGRAALAGDGGNWARIVASGDDYEVLIAVPPERADVFMRRRMRWVVRQCRRST
ncbi:MAG: AIR synthase-related protein [Hyphomicrobiaceae bacterium]